MQKIYNRINWENKPSTRTPVNASNLNIMDYSIDALDDRIIELWDYLQDVKGMGNFNDIQKIIDKLFLDEDTSGSILNVIKQYMDLHTSYNYKDMMLYIFGQDTTIYYLKPPTNVRIENTDEGFGLKWNDPPDVTAPDGTVLGAWIGTRVVIKPDAPPVEWDDGDAILVKESLNNDFYNTNSLFYSGLTNGRTYYIGIFPHTNKAYTIDTVIKFTPQPIYPDPAVITNIENLDEAVKLQFTIPTTSGISSVKLVYGLHEPSDDTDGKILNVKTSDIDITVENLINNKRYYFKLFVYTAKKRMASLNCVDIVPTETYPTQKGEFIFRNDSPKKIYVQYIDLHGNSYSTIVFNKNHIPTTPDDGEKLSGHIADYNSVYVSVFNGDDVATDYYYSIFVYNKKGRYLLSESGVATTGGTPPTDWHLVPMSFIKQKLQEHYNGTINLKNLWGGGKLREIENWGVPTNSSLINRITGKPGLKIFDYNHDDLADGSGKAAVTVAITTKSFNAKFDETNHSHPNWATSELANYINSDEFINAVFPTEFIPLLKTVKKKYYTDSTYTEIKEMNCRVFIPSLAELQHKYKHYEDGYYYNYTQSSWDYSVSSITRTLSRSQTNLNDPPDTVYYEYLSSTTKGESFYRYPNNELYRILLCFCL